jgi:hypothetical protein
MKPIRILIVWCFFQSVLLTAKAQRMKEILEFAKTIPLNFPFSKDNSQLQRDFDEYSLQPDSYLLSCNIRQIYGLSIEKVLLIAYEDTARAIKFFLPFDSSLHKRIEEDLGPSVGAWMAVDDEEIDTSTMIANRRWILPEYIIVFECTRYIKLLGQHKKDDRIMITIGKRKAVEKGNN